MGSKGKWAAALLTTAGTLAVVAVVAEDAGRVAAGAPSDAGRALSAYELRLGSWLDEPLGGEPGCGRSGRQSRRARR